MSRQRHFQKWEIVKDIRNSGIASFYDAGGSIGKRYRRQDEAGTPFGITVDHDTLEDNTVTLRDRDTMEQERISIDCDLYSKRPN